MTESAPNNKERRWKQENYRQLEAWVMAYQAGDPTAAGKICHAYKDFVESYTTLVKTGNCNILSHSLRHFLALFAARYLPKDIQNQKDPNPYNSMVQNTFYGAAQWLATKFAPYSAEEITNELLIGLLEMAKRYTNIKPEGAYFHTYVLRAFHYTAYTRLCRMIRDPLVFYSQELVEFNEDEIPDLQTRPPEDLVWEGAFKVRSWGADPAEYGNLELDDNWINGYNCDPLFADLTPLDRRILALGYAQGYRNSEIAEMLGFSVSAINKRKTEIRRKLKEKGAKLGQY